jgi:hypothetical protein
MLKGLVYTSCPYAMPRVTFDSAGTDDDALRKAMGMHENEDRDKYIKRMKVSSDSLEGVAGNDLLARES